MNGAIRVDGRALRRARKRAYPSADAFAAACGSVSTPTVYRAERGGPILRPYLDRMAAVLNLSPDDIIAPASTRQEGQGMSGEWFGLYVCTDRFGRPVILTEDVHLSQDADRVEGYSGHTDCQRSHCDTFQDCTFQNNIFTGRISSVDRPFPLDAPSFVLSGTRDLRWLSGFLTWFDMDSQRVESSRYFLIRKETDSFAADVAEAQGALGHEIRLHYLRHALETGINLDNALTLVR